MKALVATVNCILFVDINTRKIEILESERREYYGISWWPESEELVMSHSGLANDSLIDLESYIQSEKGYLSFGERISSRFLSQPHQIFCAPQEIVITSNTGRNCVSLYNFNNGFCKDLRINDIYWDRLGKENTCGEHFNSVFLSLNRLYVLAHRFKKNSQVLVYSYPECQLIERFETKNRSGMHNIWADSQGNLIACHSEAGELIEVKTNETIWASGSSHYTRGLAASNDFLVLGDSEITERNKRKALLSELWVIDRKTMTTLDYLPLGNYGAVHEVRLLDLPDEAHHAKPFRGLDQIERKLAQNEDKEQAYRSYKLQKSHDSQMHREQMKHFISVNNGWRFEKDWIAPKNESLTLALAQDSLSIPYVISADYQFVDSKLPRPFFSLIFAYQGPADANMLSLMLSYNPSNKLVAVSLWAHEGQDWQPKELLIPIVKKEGSISLTVEADRIIINCNDLPAITKIFEPIQLLGGCGIRVHEAQFKNLRARSTQFWKGSINKVKELMSSNKNS